MRKTRRLLLLALVLTATAVGVIYKNRSAAQARNAPPPPRPLAQDVQAASQDWVYYKGDGDRPIIEVRAKEMERAEQPSAHIRLKQVDLRLYDKSGKRFDHVRSASAEFDESAASLYADGQVEITLAVPEAKETTEVQREHLLKIFTSGVRFEAATGKAATDRPLHFAFDLGEGSAVGATYDPQSRDLHLVKDVKLHWRGRDPKRPPMEIEAAGLTYREEEARVFLHERSHFERQSLKMDGADSVITLEEGMIRHVEASKSRGNDIHGGRSMTFAADTLKLELNEHSDIEHVVGEGNGQAEVTSAGANTTITTDRLQLDFDAATGESILRQALANGKAELNSRPKAGTPQITARRLRSEAIVARMKPGGEDLEQVETHAPGTLELLPLAAGQRARRLDATRMWMQYGPRSVMESFRAVEVQTRTEPLRRGDPSVTTVSHDMTASFDANGTIRAMEQWDKFRYDEGPKHATADRAALDQAASRMTLTGNARTWDAAGQVIADSIALQQSNGDMTAQGNVHSTRVPERKAKAAPDANTLLASDEPLNGQSDKLSISGGNAVIIHEGRAVVWQSANKIQADRVAIDRKSGTLTAEGNVVSFLADRAVPGKASVMTAVRSKRLDYDDPTRLARYSGDTRMTRPGLDVRSAELRAWLSAGESATLDRLFADQNVTILQSVSGRTRQGKGEHAEYYLKEEKVILSGGNPVLTDSVKGASRGEKLTYWADKDNLLVDGAPAGPAVSRIRRD